MAPATSPAIPLSRSASATPPWRTSAIRPGSGTSRRCRAPTSGWRAWRSTPCWCSSTSRNCYHRPGRQGAQRQGFCGWLARPAGTGQPAGPGVDRQGLPARSHPQGPIRRDAAGTSSSASVGPTGAAATGTPCCMARSVRAAGCSGSSRCTWGSAEHIDPDATHTPEGENPAGMPPGKHLRAPAPWPGARAPAADWRPGSGPPRGARSAARREMCPSRSRKSTLRSRPAASSRCTETMRIGQVRLRGVAAMAGLANDTAVKPRRRLRRARGAERSAATRVSPCAVRKPG